MLTISCINSTLGKRLGLVSFAKNSYSLARSLWASGREERGQIFDLSSSKGLFNFLFGDNTSGEYVSPESSMRIATVYSCVNFRSDSVAILPIKPYKQEGESKFIDKSHPAYKLLTCKPNPWMNAGFFWKLVCQTVDIKGDAYAEIIRDARMRPIRFDYLCFDDVVIAENSAGNPVYFYKGRAIAHTDIFHFKNFSLDGKQGISTISQHQETFGSAKRLRKFANRSLSNIPPIYASSDQSLPMNPDAKNQTKEYLKGEFNSFISNGTIPILWNGVKMNSIGVSAQDVAYLDQINATKEDIHGIFKVNPVLIQATQKGPGVQNYEQLFLQYLTFTLLPILKMIEEEVNEKLFIGKDAETHFVKFNTRAILQADHKTQAEWFKTLWGIGILSQNDIRDCIDMNPIEDGDRYYVPVNNMMPTDLVDEYFTNMEESASGDLSIDSATGEDDLQEHSTEKKKIRKYSIVDLLKRDIKIHVNGKAVEHV